MKVLIFYIVAFILTMAFISFVLPGCGSEPEPEVMVDQPFSGEMLALNECPRNNRPTYSDHYSYCKDGYKCKCVKYGWMDSQVDCTCRKLKRNRWVGETWEYQ